MQSTSDIWYIVFVLIVIAYFVYSAVTILKVIARKRALMTKKNTCFYKWLRSKFYLASMYQLRSYIVDYCSRYSGHKGSTVQAIIMYEIDLNYYRDLFINQGYDRLFVETLTKLEEISQFVIEWKQANAYLTSSQMLELYLNETKPN
jgi:hypothetical protein